MNIKWCKDLDEEREIKTLEEAYQFLAEEGLMISHITEIYTLGISNADCGGDEWDNKGKEPKDRRFYVGIESTGIPEHTIRELNQIAGFEGQAPGTGFPPDMDKIIDQIINEEEPINILMTLEAALAFCEEWKPKIDARFRAAFTK